MINRRYLLEKKCSQISIANKEIFVEVPALQERNCVFKLLRETVKHKGFISVLMCFKIMFKLHYY